MVPKWGLVTLKWEGNIHKWEVVIALTRPADNSNSNNARKSQANADALRSPLEAAILLSL